MLNLNIIKTVITSNLHHQTGLQNLKQKKDNLSNFHGFQQIFTKCFITN